MTDLTGKKYSLLTVVSLHGTRPYPSGGSRRVWLCQCECGNKRLIEGKNLRNGHTTSCGAKKHNHNYHGLTNTPIYHAWENMIARCTKPQHPSWKDYGGRGITVCERWKSATAFIEDMFGGWRPGLSLDRRDNAKGYNPSNCRWILPEMQPLNTRKTRLLTVGGITLAAKQWSRKTGIHYNTLLNRLNRGWSHEQAIQP